MIENHEDLQRLKHALSLFHMNSLLNVVTAPAIITDRGIRRESPKVAIVNMYIMRIPTIHLFTMNKM